MPLRIQSGKAKILAAIAYTVVVFGAGWAVNGWRIDAATVKNKDTTIADMRSSADAVNAAEGEAMNRKETAHEETKRIADGVDDGLIGLRVEAECLHSATDAGGVETATAELAGQSRRAYRTHREGIVEVQENLRLCIAYARECDAARGR